MTEPNPIRPPSLLLSCMDPKAGAWERSLNAHRSEIEEIDWRWVLERARAHKLIGMLTARALAAEVREDLPETVQTELEGEREAGLAHRARVARTLAEVRDRLAALKCPFLVVKGSAYAHDVYGDPTMRRFSDIDILIPHEMMEDVDRAFKEDGYYFWANPEIHNKLPRWFRRQAPPGEEPGSEAQARRILEAFHRHHLYVLKEDDPRMHVEVHWHVFVPSEGRASAEDLWSETRSTSLEGIEVRTLDWEASLLHAAVHAMEQAPTEYRLLHLADVAWMLGRWGEIVDPRKLQELARAWGLVPYLKAAVMAVERVLPQGLPEGAGRIWPQRGAHRRSIRGGLLSAAGFGPWIIDQEVSGARARRLGENAWREGLWELALGRRPGTAWGRVIRTVQTRVPRGRAGGENEVAGPKGASG
ncbi:MAG: nucleotidyltransferase family protein [Gemmatimonadetes bacterium]|nr:nucleotidyltransferase family protein [Gemmatimonadota bacterium]